MLVKYRNTRPSQLDKWFDDFFTRDLFYNNTSINRSKKVNVKETQTAFNLYLEVPGFSKDELSIHIDAELLKISGKKGAVEANEEESFIRKEFSQNEFSRTFTIPETVNVEDITAKYESGILALTLPKMEKQEQELKTIEIK